MVLKSIQERVIIVNLIYFHIALIFDLDNTLVKSAYKKHKMSDYDSYIYVNILGTKRIRVNYF